MTRRAPHTSAPFAALPALVLAPLLALPLLALGACSSTKDTLAASTAPAGTASATEAALAGQRSFGANTQIPAVVNGEPITRNQVKRRAAFLKLRRAPKTGTAAARDELVEEAIKMQEARRRGVNVPEGRVSDAYANFARSNKMSVTQLNQIMNQSGVTPAGFKDYIRAQIAWSSLVAQNGPAAGGAPLTEREAVARMLERGGQKPTANEYLLQQVVFLVPQAQRTNARVAARKREAEAMRQRFTTCEATAGFAAGLKDVTVRDLGRKLGPELPPDWKPLVEKTVEGRTTAVRTTPRGAEFLAVCRLREVSDDRTAQIVFSREDAKDAGGDAGAAYLAKLKKASKIEIR